MNRIAFKAFALAAALALSPSAVSTGQSVDIDGNNNTVNLTINYGDDANSATVLFAITARDKSGARIHGNALTNAPWDYAEGGLNAFLGLPGDSQIPANVHLPDIAFCVRAARAQEICTLAFSGNAAACKDSATCNVAIEGMPLGPFTIRVLDVDPAMDPTGPDEIGAGRCDTAMPLCEVGNATIRISRLR